MGAALASIGSVVAGKVDAGTAITKLFRFVYTGTALSVTALWYTGWRNQRIAPGDKTSIPIPGLATQPATYPASRGNKATDRPPPLAPMSSADIAAGAGFPGTPPLVPLPQLGASGNVKIGPDANRPGTSIAPETMQFLQRVAGIAKRTLFVGTGTNHSRLTVDGNVSDHWDGHAADIPYNARDAGQAAQGDIVAAAAMMAAGVPAATAHQRARAGGLYTMQWNGHRVQVIWKTMQGGNHYTHVHIGYR